MLYKTGWHGLSALRYMVEDDERDSLYKDYTATMQRHLVTLVGCYMLGSKWQELPSYISLAHPEIGNSKDSIESAKQHIKDIFGVDVDAVTERR